MLEASRERIEALPAELSVLDVGGWASPLERADAVVDLMPYETRGLYGRSDPARERFSAGSWHTRDICDREPWPFRDGEFDFVVCSHTLEDVRDPVWVCSEINRVGTAGYIEVPSRLEEQTPGVHGPWVGWSHHHWLVDVRGREIVFTLKPHLLNVTPEFWIQLTHTQSQPPERRVATLWWEDVFVCREQIFFEPQDLHDYLREAVEGPPFDEPGKADNEAGRLRHLVSRLRP
jgi:hypothetical protein